jgi:hypothetical protein
MRVAQSDKHGSSLKCVINYHGKKFYVTGPGFSHHIFAEVEFNHLAVLSCFVSGARAPLALLQFCIQS